MVSEYRWPLAQVSLYLISALFHLRLGATSWGGGGGGHKVFSVSKAILSMLSTGGGGGSDRLPSCLVTKQAVEFR